jgi:predicted DNA-binding ribbon-helix-helix protein
VKKISFTVEVELTDEVWERCKKAYTKKDYDYLQTIAAQNELDYNALIREIKYENKSKSS